MPENERNGFLGLIREINSNSVWKKSRVDCDHLVVIEVVRKWVEAGGVKRTVFILANPNENPHRTTSEKAQGSVFLLCQGKFLFFQLRV
jgi:hypothetical protein